MKIIALEEHFIMPKEEQNLPPGAHRGKIVTHQERRATLAQPTRLSGT